MGLASAHFRRAVVMGSEGNGITWLDVSSAAFGDTVVNDVSGSALYVRGMQFGRGAKHTVTLDCSSNIGRTKTGIYLNAGIDHTAQITTMP